MKDIPTERIDFGVLDIRFTMRDLSMVLNSSHLDHQLLSRLNRISYHCLFSWYQSTVRCLPAITFLRMALKMVIASHDDNVGGTDECH